jgi:6-phosphogluconolactonase (cycloisomerase 2 family)
MRENKGRNSVIVWIAMLAMIESAVADTFVYISVARDKRIAVYQMNEKEGTLTHQQDVATMGSPGVMDTDPGRKFLFVALHQTGKLASFRIDATTGELTPINEIDVEDTPAYVKSDHTGRFLFSAYYGAGKVGVHAIAADGSLSQIAVQWIYTASKAHAIVPDPSNRFVFVPHTGPNLIYQYHFDAITGRLTSNAFATITTPKTDEPRHMAFHPTAELAFVVNEKGNSVTAFWLNENDGTLNALKSVSTIPDDFTETSLGADIEVHPTGKFVYASNRGHDSIAGFSINQRRGTITPIGRSQTDKRPRSFNIEPGGRFLYAAGRSTDQLGAYRINQLTGELTRFASYTVGKGPRWVQAVRIPE